MVAPVIYFVQRRFGGTPLRKAIYLLPFLLFPAFVQADVDSFGLWIKGADWNNKKVFLQMNWQGRLNGGIYGANWTKITHSGFASGTITGTLIWQQTSETGKLTSGNCQFAVTGGEESLLHLPLSCRINPYGTFQQYDWNRTLIVDWPSRRAYFLGDSTGVFSPPQYDENGLPIMGVPDDGGEAERRSWFLALFTMSEGKKAELQAALQGGEPSGFEHTVWSPSNYADENLPGSISYSVQRIGTGGNSNGAIVHISTDCMPTSADLPIGPNDGTGAWSIIQGSSFSAYQHGCRTILTWVIGLLTIVGFYRRFQSVG